MPTTDYPICGGEDPGCDYATATGEPTPDAEQRSTRRAIIGEIIGHAPRLVVCHACKGLGRIKCLGVGVDGPEQRGPVGTCGYCDGSGRIHPSRRLGS